MMQELILLQDLVELCAVVLAGHLGCRENASMLSVDVWPGSYHHHHLGRRTARCPLHHQMWPPLQPG